MKRLLVLIRYTVQACIPRPQRLGLGGCAALALVFGLLARVANTAHGGEGNVVVGVAATSLFGLVLPLACLVIGDALLAADIRRGTFLYTYLSPAPLAAVVLGRFIGGVLVATSILVPSFTLAVVIGGDASAAAGIAAATFLSLAAYLAIMLCLGAAFRRATVAALVFVLLIERLLGTAVASIAQWTPVWLGANSFVGWSGAVLGTRDGVPSGGRAVINLVAITVVGLVIATWRLSKLRLSGASD